MNTMNVNAGDIGKEMYGGLARAVQIPASNSEQGGCSEISRRGNYFTGVEFCKFCHSVVEVENLRHSELWLICKMCI